MSRLLLAAIGFLMAIVVTGASAPAGTTKEQVGPRVHNLAPTFIEYWNRVEGKSIEEKVGGLKAGAFSEFPQYFDYKIEKWKQTRKDPDLLLRKNLEEFPAIKDDFIRRTNEITGNLESTLRSFVQALPNLDRNFDVYIVHSLGDMDGGTRLIGNKVYFILGIDGIVNYHKGYSSDVPFFHHELFHVYHGQHLPEDKVFWVSLWAEGLATYASEKLNPGTPLKDLMLDLPEGMVDQISKDLPFYWKDIETKLSSTNDDDYEAYFLMSSTNKKIVKRAGYYVGYLIAKELGKSRSLTEMAEMDPKTILPLLRSTIEGLKNSSEQAVTERRSL